jgi:hypothetical protein
MAYAIYLQYDKASLDYVLQGELSSLSADILHDKYLIKPNGSADSWNKSLQIQKAYQRFQSLGNNPYVDQGELTKSLIELDDPGLVKRLWRDPKIAQGDQTKLQSLETLLMLNNFGATVEPSDDDKIHLSALAQFGQQRMQERLPITPLQAQLFKLHIQGDGKQTVGHLGQMQQKKDKQVQQYAKMLQPFLQILDQLIQSGQQQAGNVVPMQQSTKSAETQKQPDPQANAAKLINSLASARKSGIPMGIDQFNAALQEAGYPPLQAQQPQPQPMPPAA